MTDDMQIQVFVDQMDFVLKSSKRTYDKFEELYNAIGDVSSSINGYPSQTIEKLDEVLYRVGVLEQAICNIPTTSKQITKQGNIKFLHYVLVFFLMMLGSFVGSVLHAMFFNK